MTDSYQNTGRTAAARLDQPGRPTTAGSSTHTRHASGSNDSGVRGDGRTSDPGHEARRAAHEMAEAGREQARSYIDEQRFTAADRIQGMAEALRSTAHDLEGRDGQSSRFTQSAAERADRFADLLREHDADSLLFETRALARRSPALFFGGAVTAGVLLGRFLKSSAEREHGEPERELWPTPPPGAASPGAQGMGDRDDTEDSGTGRARNDG